MANVEGLIDFLAAGYRNGPVPVDVGERIAKFVDGDARWQSPDYTVETGFDLVRKKRVGNGLNTVLNLPIIGLSAGTENALRRFAGPRERVLER